MKINRPVVFKDMSNGDMFLISFNRKYERNHRV